MKLRAADSLDFECVCNTKRWNDKMECQ